MRPAPGAGRRQYRRECPSNIPPGVRQPSNAIPDSLPMPAAMRGVGMHSNMEG